MTKYPQAEASSANTHTVENVPPLLENYSLYNDITLKEAVEREGVAWAEEELSEFGQLLGSADWIHKGTEANRVKPVIATHDRYGNRIDEVTYHPAYHEFMALSKKHGLIGRPSREAKEGSHVVRAAIAYMTVQVEAGHGCPASMTNAAIDTILKQPEIADEWIPKIISDKYDERNIVHTKKDSVTIGMAMTEKQGGSDVRQNSTKAYAIGESGPGKTYELVGHKYFVSAPMSDAFLTLAQTDKGLSCFLVPRWRPDGTKNPLQIIRLKDKMGNVSNASGESELRGAMGWLIGEEGRGAANILEMVAMTRFDSLVASAASMRQHLTQIVHHTSHRNAFGSTLDKQPLMQNVLADLELETEAATHMAFRIARSLDGKAAGNSEENSLSRITIALGKYWICKRHSAHAAEAMECIGGAGVMENGIMARFYREAPINGIWEGSGNVQCLDLLRIMAKDPMAVGIFIKELEKASGKDSRYDDFLISLKKEFTNLDDMQYRARSLVEKMSLAFQGSLLLLDAPEFVAQAFCASRLTGEIGSNNYGTLPKGVDCAALIDRARIMK